VVQYSRKLLFLAPSRKIHDHFFALSQGPRLSTAWAVSLKIFLARLYFSSRPFWKGSLGLAPWPRPWMLGWLRPVLGRSAELGDCIVVLNCIISVIITCPAREKWGGGER